VGIVVERSEVKANSLEQWIIPSDPPAIFHAAALGGPDGSGRPRRGELPQAIGVPGRIVQDVLAAVDYAASRPEVDASRIGLVGYSLGGTSGGCAAILDERIRAAVIAGWVFSPRYTRPTEAKWCTVVPYEAFARRMDFAEMTALLAPHCATLFMLGDRADTEGVAIEPLYDMPERERGLEVVDAAVRYRRPEELACFPGERPPLEYTMQGWIDGRAVAEPVAAAIDRLPPPPAAAPPAPIWQDDDRSHSHPRR
jgi:hypothetical protein